MKKNTQKNTIKSVPDKAVDLIANAEQEGSDQIDRFHFNYAGMYLFPLFPMGDLALILYELKRAWKNYSAHHQHSKHKDITDKGAAK